MFAWTAQAATVTVQVRDDRYSKSTVRISPGTKVTFDWVKTRNEHDVTVDSGPQNFQSRTTSSSSYAFTKKFTRRGTYKLFCTVHPDDMRIRVIVKRPD